LPVAQTKVNRAVPLDEIHEVSSKTIYRNYLMIKDEANAILGATPKVVEAEEIIETA